MAPQATAHVLGAPVEKAIRHVWFEIRRGVGGNRREHGDRCDVRRQTLKHLEADVALEHQVGQVVRLLSIGDGGIAYLRRLELRSDEPVPATSG